MTSAEYMREYRKKKKEEKQNDNLKDKKIVIESGEVVNENENENKESEYIEPEVIKNPNPKENKKGKKKKIITPMTPDGFADFSVSTEKTTLAFRKAKLEPADQHHIENSAKALAGIYNIPEALIIGDYIIAMVTPHVTLTLDRMSAKEELEIIQLSDELRNKGYDVDTKTLLNMTPRQREEYISKLEKDKKLKDLKKDVFKPDDIITGD